MSDQPSFSPPSAPSPPISVRLLDGARRRLLWAVLAAYVCAALLPGPGLALRVVVLARPVLPVLGEVPLTMSAALLGFVLFTAAFGIQPGLLADLARRPVALITGVCANVVLPLLALPLLALGVHLWPYGGRSASLLVGIALIGAMPVAAGATVYGARAGANAALTVAVVLASTALSPVTLPLTLAEAARLTGGAASGSLRRLSRTGGGAFALVSVVLPCVAALAARRLSPERHVRWVLPWVKLAALAAGVALTYLNAAGALGAVVGQPDLPLLAADVVAAAAVCTASLACGHWLGRALKLARPEAVAVTVTSGMNNSSASAVLAVTRLADQPAVLVPVLAYSMIQKIAACVVDGLLSRDRPSGTGPPRTPVAGA
ncbi:sodium-dependent transporter [Streptomyces sp. RB6PN25]|uniref:Sodium-dependent transporter n=1 Tax=Streptomyces humicola TaxID=2953240 RepID=A0ABT1PTP2_9ACTN|nr:sodium-dependent transporter [Streptomyces humicola]MCQ4081026.1 sodium-dependent transporter [Streptomyces humicola]